MHNKKNKKLVIVALLFAVILFLSPLAAGAVRPFELRIVGSSLLYSYLNLASEFFDALQELKAKHGATIEKIRIITESTGSGGGIKVFCDKDDRIMGSSVIAVSSTRKMTDSERQRCKKNSYQIKERFIGSGAIVLVSRSDSIKNLSTLDIFKATAKYHPKDGAWVKNQTKFWSDINSKLPMVEVKFIGPSFNSGALHVFLEKIHKYYYDLYNMPKKYRGIREQGVYSQAGDSEAVIMTKLLQRNRGDSSIAIVDFGYYMISDNKGLNLISVDGITPDKKSVTLKKYPLNRSFYIYHKTNHGNSEKFQKFLDFFFSKEFGDVLSGYGVFKAQLYVGQNKS